MVKPFDLTKFKKEHNKKHAITDGFYDPYTWIDTGNYALNRMISGDFQKGIPLGAVTVVAGEPGSGKSYVVSGNIVKDALAQGVIVLLVDTEGGLTNEWLRKLGVDPKHPNLVMWEKHTINEVAAMIHEFMETFRADNKNLPRAEQQKVLFVIDSLGFVESDNAIAQFEAAELKGDKGIKPKQLKMLVSNCLRLFSGVEAGLVATNHTYKSQDQWNTDDVISGGGGFIFAASIIVGLTKSKLKDAKDKKIVRGIISRVKCVKTRYAKPFEEVQVLIPWETGMDRYSGLAEFFGNRGSIKKNGSWYCYTDKTGKDHKQQGDEFPPAMFDLMMSEFTDTDTDPVPEPVPPPETPDGQ